MIYLFGIIVTLLIASFIPSVGGQNTVLSINNKNITAENLLKLLCMLPMFLISALRFNVGSDFLAVYWNGFQRVQAGINTDNFEIGFQGLIKLLGKISSSPQILIIFTSFLFVFFTWNAIYDQSNDIIFSLLILFISRYYFISLNVIRQLIAMAIILYALKYLKEGKDIKYILFNLIAFTIHRSALICLVFLLIKKIDLTKLKYLLMFLGLLILIYGLNQIGVIRNQITLLLINSSKYSTYVQEYNSGGYYAGRNFVLYQIILNFLIFIMEWYASRENVKVDETYRIYLNIQALTLIICMIFNAVPLIERIYWYFGFIQILSIPYTIKMYSKLLSRYVWSLIIILFMGIFCVYDIFVMHDHQAIPYVSMFSMH